MFAFLLATKPNFLSHHNYDKIPVPASLLTIVKKYRKIDTTEEVSLCPLRLSEMI